MKKPFRRSAKASYDVLWRASEKAGHISYDLSKDEMKINSGFRSISLLMVNISNPNVLLKDPEDSLQLPAIAENDPQRDRFHGEICAEVNKVVILTNEAHQVFSDHSLQFVAAIGME